MWAGLNPGLRRTWFPTHRVVCGRLGLARKVNTPLFSPFLSPSSHFWVVAQPMGPPSVRPFPGRISMDGT